ncbi:hypothetical protein TvY486_0026130, partial [Trypanosoma vivax Y486]
MGALVFWLALVTACTAQAAPPKGLGKTQTAAICKKYHALGNASEWARRVGEEAATNRDLVTERTRQLATALATARAALATKLREGERQRASTEEARRAVGADTGAKADSRTKERKTQGDAEALFAQVEKTLDTAAGLHATLEDARRKALDVGKRSAASAGWLGSFLASLAATVTGSANDAVVYSCIDATKQALSATDTRAGGKEDGKQGDLFAAACGQDGAKLASNAGITLNDITAALTGSAAETEINGDVSPNYVGAAASSHSNECPLLRVAKAYGNRQNTGGSLNIASTGESSLTVILGGFLKVKQATDNAGLAFDQTEKNTLGGENLADLARNLTDAATDAKLEGEPCAGTAQPLCDARATQSLL